MTQEQASNLALEFLSRNFETLASLAWPVVALIVLSMFKAEIVKLLPFLKWKQGDNEFSFAVNNALVTNASVPETEAPTPAPVAVEKQTRFERLLAVSAYSAVMEIRFEIEQALRARALREGQLGDARIAYLTTSRLIGTLAKNGVIGDEIAELVRELTYIGNMAAHERTTDISDVDARNYRRLADRVIAALNSDTLQSAQE